MPFGRRAAPSDGRAGNSGNSADAPASVKCTCRYLPTSPLELPRPVGEIRRGRVQQQARRLERLRAEDDGARAHVVYGTRRAIDVFDADGLALRRIHQHAMRHRAGDERQLAGRKSVGDGRERRVEVRVRRAATLARPAVMAGRAAVQRRGEVGGAPDRDQPIQLRADTVAYRALRTGHRHRRLERPVRQPGVVLSCPDTPMYDSTMS